MITTSEHHDCCQQTPWQERWLALAIAALLGLSALAGRLLADYMPLLG